MFKFLKEKLKGAISKISEGVEKEGKIEEQIVEKPVEEKGFFSKLKEKIIGKAEEEIKETVKEEPEIIEHPKEVKIPQVELEKEPFQQKIEQKPQIIEEKDEIKVEIEPKEIEKTIEIEKEVPKEEKIQKDASKTHTKKHDKKSKKTREEYLEQKKEELEEEIKKKEEKVDLLDRKKSEIFDSKEKKEVQKFEKKEIPKEEKFEQKKATVEQMKTSQEVKVEIKQIPKTIEKIEPKIEIPEPIEKPVEKKGFFATIKEKIITTKINEDQFEKLFWELEMALMENNFAIDVIEKIKDDLKQNLVEKPIRRTKVEETIEISLKDSILGLFEKSNFNLINEIKNKQQKPYIITFLGINGSGKTTSIAKVANMLKHNGFSCVLAAGDTFRAASIEQLQQHADKLGIKMIKHDYGSDPAAVAFDAIKHAQAKNIDVVLIDTAGRMQTNSNLIDEMKKIVRVAKPDLKIFVGESITGNDCVEQARTFNEEVGIDGIILSKADIDEKGGAAISVSYVTKKPILYFGVGQHYKDLEPFSQEKVMKNIGFA